MAFTVTSPAFTHGGVIPKAHTCVGDDRSPPLQWSSPPSETRSFALIVDDPDAPDPDAPQRTWVHWVLYDLPPTATGLEEGVTAAELPPGAKEGLNDWKTRGYRGPCPPIGRHRYYHKLFALDTTLTGLSHPTKAELERAMEGHVLAQAELVGLFQR
jgi:Raf kinase inhibitor-like YbhB/YbcL family protein